MQQRPPPILTGPGAPRPTPLDGRPMVKCYGCGFHVEQEDVRDWGTVLDADGHLVENSCETCAKCEAVPDLRVSYRRGFNAGLDAMGAAVQNIITTGNLRKPPHKG